MPIPTSDRAADYRRKAALLREQAELPDNRPTRDMILSTADLWESMARYEEANPTAGILGLPDA